MLMLCYAIYACEGSPAPIPPNCLLLRRPLPPAPGSARCSSCSLWSPLPSTRTPTADDDLHETSSHRGGAIPLPHPGCGGVIPHLEPERAATGDDDDDDDDDGDGDDDDGDDEDAEDDEDDEDDDGDKDEDYDVDKDRTSNRCENGDASGDDDDK